MRDFKKLNVWKESRVLNIEIYKIKFPQEEIFGLQSQIRRSSTSVGSNITEGCGKDTNKDFKRYLDIALGSLYETEHHLIVSNDLNFINDVTLDMLLKKVNILQRMLITLIQTVRPKGR